MQYSTIAHCSSLGDTLKEKFEGIYIKLVELENILRAKADAKNEVFNLEKNVRLEAGDNVIKLFQASTSALTLVEDDGRMGGVWYDRWELYYDPTKDPNSVAIVTSSGSALLTVHNLF